MRNVNWVAKSGPMREVVFAPPDAEPIDVLILAIRQTAATSLSIFSRVGRSGHPSWWMMTRFALEKAGLWGPEEKTRALALEAALLETPEEPARPPVDSAQISAVMAELGRRGGLKGGPRRAARLSPERRREIALLAARKRWDSRG